MVLLTGRYGYVYLSPVFVVLELVAKIVNEHNFDIDEIIVRPPWVLVKMQYDKYEFARAFRDDRMAIVNGLQVATSTRGVSIEF